MLGEDWTRVKRLIMRKEVRTIELRNFLEEKTIFKGLTEQEMSRVVDIMGIREFRRKEVIFLEGDIGESFYLVLTGEVRIFKLSPDGREKTLAMMGSGDYFGEMALIEEKVRSASAETLTKSKLGIIYREHFLQLIHDHPEISLKMFVQLGERLRKTNQQIEFLVFKDAKTRLILYLLQSAKSDGKNPVALLRKDTHQEIANLIGSSRETVTRMLGQLQDEGYITLEGRNIYIVNYCELEKLSV